MEISNKEYSCCFSGHRELPSGQLEKIKERLKYEVVRLINEGVHTFYNGYASGFDAEAALTVNELKKEYPHIKLVLVLPYRQDVKISYDECVCIAEKYRKGCFHIRNRFLVDNSSYCICYFTENTGGTAYTVDYAKKQRLRVYNISEYTKR